MTLISINWKKFIESFSKIEYFTFDEKIENAKLKILLDKDDKESLKTKQFNTWKYPLERQNPDIIAMILNLNERLSKIENEYKHRIKALEQDNMTMKAIFTCNGEKEPEPHNGNGTLEDLEIYYNNNHKEENQEEFKLPNEEKK